MFSLLSFSVLSLILLLSALVSLPLPHAHPPQPQGDLPQPPICCLGLLDTCFSHPGLKLRPTTTTITAVFMIPSLYLQNVSSIFPMVWFYCVFVCSWVQGQICIVFWCNSWHLWSGKKGHNVIQNYWVAPKYKSNLKEKHYKNKPSNLTENCHFTENR